MTPIHAHVLSLNDNTMRTQDAGQEISYHRRCWYTLLYLLPTYFHSTLLGGINKTRFRNNLQTLHIWILSLISNFETLSYAHLLWANTCNHIIMSTVFQMRILFSFIEIGCSWRPGIMIFNGRWRLGGYFMDYFSITYRYFQSVSQLMTRVPCYWHGFTLIQAWISKH